MGEIYLFKESQHCKFAIKSISYNDKHFGITKDNNKI